MQVKTIAFLFFSISLLLNCHESKQYKKLLIHKQYIHNNFTSNNIDEKWNKLNIRSSNNNLWNFISNELKMQIPDNAPVCEQQKRYLKQIDYLYHIILKAEPYMYWITDQIKKRNMPMELALIPIIESSFNPKAISVSNAAGLWQIVPKTGKDYGLKQNKWYDGRLDIVASTTVALNIMQRLNRIFNGDWLLTIAAYNSGEKRIIQAIKRNRVHGLPTDFWSLKLPKETTVYVPKVLAISKIIKNSKRFGVILPSTNALHALSQVEINQQIEFKQISKLSGLSLNDIKKFNTGYKLNTTAPDGPYYIMLPKLYADRLRSSLTK